MPYRCWVAPSALRQMAAEANRRLIRETGGALLGWFEDSDYVIAQVLGPGPKAVHGWSHFEPDAGWQVNEGRRIYETTGRRVRYLGDWHTHPRGGCAPSPTDLETVAAIAIDRDFAIEKPLYAIMCRPWTRVMRGNSWNLLLGVWVVDSLELLDLRSYDGPIPQGLDT